MSAWGWRVTRLLRPWFGAWRRNWTACSSAQYPPFLTPIRPVMQPPSLPRREVSLVSPNHSRVYPAVARTTDTQGINPRIPSALLTGPTRRGITPQRGSSAVSSRVGLDRQQGPRSWPGAQVPNVRRGLRGTFHCTEDSPRRCQKKKVCPPLVRFRDLVGRVRAGRSVTVPAPVLPWPVLEKWKHFLSLVPMHRLVGEPVRWEWRPWWRRSRFLSLGPDFTSTLVRARHGRRPAGGNGPSPSSRFLPLAVPVARQQALPGPCPTGPTRARPAKSPVAHPMRPPSLRKELSCLFRNPVAATIKSRALARVPGSSSHHAGGLTVR
jgi:hypothetical protein